MSATQAYSFLNASASFHWSLPVDTRLHASMAISWLNSARLSFWHVGVRSLGHYCAAMPCLSWQGGQLRWTRCVSELCFIAQLHQQTCFQSYWWGPYLASCCRWNYINLVGLPASVSLRDSNRDSSLRRAFGCSVALAWLDAVSFAPN